MGDKERLFGYLEGGGRMILAEPQALLTESSKLPGLDGQKMSKSYNNSITLREDGRFGDEESAHHADGPGAGEAQRPRRPGEMPGVAAASGVLGCEHPGWCSRAAGAPHSGASNASNL